MILSVNSNNNKIYKNMEWIIKLPLILIWVVILAVYDERN